MSKHKVNVPDILMFILITFSFFFISESIASQSSLQDGVIPVQLQEHDRVNLLVRAFAMQDVCRLS